MRAILLLIILSSCASPKKIARICATCPVKDSVSVVEVYRDTTIYITDHRVEYRDTLMCDSSGIVKSFKKTFKSNGVKGTVVIKNNKLTAICETDSLKKVIERLSKERHVVQTKIIEKPCDKDHRTDFDGFKSWWFYITAGLLTLFVGYKIVMSRVNWKF